MASQDISSNIAQQFVTSAFPSNPAIRALPVHEAIQHASQVIKSAPGATAIDQAMRQRGLVGMTTRAKAYAPFSQTVNRVRMVCVIPYTSTDPKSTLIGGVGISDDEPASGIVVQLENLAVTAITALDFVNGKLVEKMIPPSQLLASGPEPFVETDWPRDAAKVPNLTVSVATSVAGDAYGGFLNDEYASRIYNQEQVRQLAQLGPLITSIAELQHMRHLGVPTAASCCCCSTCSWGCSCSSSAMSTAPMRPMALPWTL